MPQMNARFQAGERSSGLTHKRSISPKQTDQLLTDQYPNLLHLQNQKASRDTGTKLENIVMQLSDDQTDKQTVYLNNKKALQNTSDLSYLKVNPKMLQV